MVAVVAVVNTDVNIMANVSDGAVVPLGELLVERP